VEPGVEVATIKPASPTAPRSGMTFRGREFVVENYSLEDLVKSAYVVQRKQIVNMPEWMSTERFDIDVEPDQPGSPNREQIHALLKKLLADRFAFRCHEEEAAMPAYVLTVAKDGPKMAKTSEVSELGGMSIGPLGLIQANNVSMSQFASGLQASVMDRPVLDKTGLDGRWDFRLKWMVDDSQFDGQLSKLQAADEATKSLPPLFTAIQEQIGLKLEAQKTEVPMLVIDHVDHPSPN
jgi:uncharacterized protein (TIGR03435 family)